MAAREINFDGLVGPTHHYAGLSPGNLASAEHAGLSGNPRASALEGIGKMRLVARLGVGQAVLPPQPRPDVSALRRLGFTGTNAVVANVEAGHVWNGHETLQHVTLFSQETGSPGTQTGQFDRHATWVAQLIGGREEVAGTDYQKGIAPDATLMSGAIATNWVGSPFTLSFNFNTATFLTPYENTMVNGVGAQLMTADVVNSSWGNSGDVTSAANGTFSRGVDALAKLSARGIAIRVMTNSLGTTDVEAVHAGCAKWRRALLRAGIELREWRLAPRATPKLKRIGVGPGWAGSAGKGSVASLHAKTFVVDRRRVFIGSFNFDPRSAYLNTELGFVIESPALACSIETAVEELLPSTTWKVTLNVKGELRWSGQHDGQPEEHLTEPGTRFHQRAGVWLLSLLPIDWLL